MSGWDDDEEDAAASDAADSFNDPESDAVGEAGKELDGASCGRLGRSGSLPHARAGVAAIAEEDLREHKAEYQPITRAAAGRLMEEVVQDVSSVLESSPSIAAALLLASGLGERGARSECDAYWLTCFASCTGGTRSAPCPTIWSAGKPF